MWGTVFRRENGTVPFGRQGDRSMFSAFVFPGNNDFWPKNGPVPGRPVNGYASCYPRLVRLGLDFAGAAGARGLVTSLAVSIEWCMGPLAIVAKRH